LACERFTAGPSVERERELIWVSRDGAVTRVDSAWTNRVVGLPALSPDGRSVAVAVQRGSGSEVWVKQLDRGPASKLADAGAAPASPANPFADTQFANPFDPTGATHPVPVQPVYGGGEDAALSQQIADAITPVLGELVTELRRSLDYYRSRGQGPGAQRIILCGGTAALPGLGPFLSAQLGLPVELANPLANVQLAAKVEPGQPPGLPPLRLDEIENKYRFMRYLEQTEKKGILNPGFDSKL